LVRKPSVKLIDGDESGLRNILERERFGDKLATQLWYTC